MKQCVEKCLGEIIVSCQAYEDSPFYGAENTKCFVQSAIMGGAKAVRCCWPADIMAARSLSDDLIIVGINKKSKTEVLSNLEINITPTLQSAIEVIEAKADIIAVDGRITPERDQEQLYNLLKQIHKYNSDIAIMTDCATYEEGVFAAETGFVDIISTTLSWRYNKNTGPDLELVKRFKSNLSLPINAEGQVWELTDIEKLHQAGADMITIGTAITRPHLITERFINHYKKVRD